MAWPMRSRPCPCGSGRTAARCCGRFRRVGAREAAGAYLGRQARPARDLVGPFSPAALSAVQAEASALAGLRPEFTDALAAAPDPVGADIRRLARVVAAAGGDTDDRRVQGALRRSDSLPARAATAKAWVGLREAGVVDEHLAAAAILDLIGTGSGVVDAALLRAAVRAARLPAAAGTHRRITARA